LIAINWAILVLVDSLIKFNTKCVIKKQLRRWERRKGINKSYDVAAHSRSTGVHPERNRNQKHKDAGEHKPIFFHATHQTLCVTADNLYSKE
jgi:hypothetical protein